MVDAPGFVDNDQAGGIEIGLALEPRQPAQGDVRPLLLGGGRGFFEANPLASKKYQIVAGQTETWRRFAKRSAISTKPISARASTKAIITRIN